jgi:hypothetical protein
MTKELKLEVGKKYKTKWHFDCHLRTVTFAADLSEFGYTGDRPLMFVGPAPYQTLCIDKNKLAEYIEEPKEEPMATKIEVGKKYNISGYAANPFKVIYDRKNEFTTDHERYLTIDKFGTSYDLTEREMENATEHREPLKNSLEGYLIYDSELQPSPGILTDKMTQKNCHTVIYPSYDEAHEALFDKFKKILKGRFTFEEIIE